MSEATLLEYKEHLKVIRVVCHRAKTIAEHGTDPWRPDAVCANMRELLRWMKWTHIQRYCNREYKVSRFEITGENLWCIDMHHVTEGGGIRVENDGVDTAKKFEISKLEWMRFGAKENWVNTWIKAAARELSKTVPLHVEQHRIYHTVVGSRRVMERRFQNYPVRVNGEGEMELLEVSPVPVAAPAAPAALSASDVIDLTMHNDSEFGAALAAGEFTVDSDSKLDLESDSSEDVSVSSLESEAYFSCNESLPSDYDSDLSHPALDRGNQV